VAMPAEPAYSLIDRLSDGRETGADDQRHSRSIRHDQSKRQESFCSSPDLREARRCGHALSRRQRLGVGVLTPAAPQLPTGRPECGAIFPLSLSRRPHP
jgi:hypothetical protein